MTFQTRAKVLPTLQVMSHTPAAGILACFWADGHLEAVESFLLEPSLTTPRPTISLTNTRHKSDLSWC